MGKLQLVEDTAPMNVSTHEEAMVIIRFRRAAKSIDGLIGDSAFEAAERIKEGTHTLDDVFFHQDSLRRIFTGFSDIAFEASSILACDFENYLNKSMVVGSTYQTAVRNLNNLGNKTANFNPRELVPLLRGVLQGRLGKDYSADFPGLLTVLWSLKSLRHKTYVNSLQGAKWAVLIGEAVNAYNAGEEIPFSIDTGELFVYALVQNAGMLDPSMPLVDSGRVLGLGEQITVIGHGPKGKSILEADGFPKSDNLLTVLNYHSCPRIYIDRNTYDWNTAAFVGVSAAAEEFEGGYFGRAHRDRLLTVSEVFKGIDKKFFRDHEIVEVKNILQMGYRYNKEQAKKYPLLQPYAMLCLLINRHERN